jgi:hypothetical protein
MPCWGAIIFVNVCDPVTTNGWNIVTDNNTVTGRIKSIYHKSVFVRAHIKELLVHRLINKFPHILRNPNVHQPTHNSLPHVPILREKKTNLVHAISASFLKTHFNIILPSTSRSCKWVLYFRFPQQRHIRIPLPHTHNTPPSPQQATKKKFIDVFTKLKHWTPVKWRNSS